MCKCFICEFAFLCGIVLWFVQISFFVSSYPAVAKFMFYGWALDTWKVSYKLIKCMSYKKNTALNCLMFNCFVL